VNLDTHIEDIVQVLQCEDLHDLVLVGHFYGGMVVAGITDRCAKRLKTRVFLDAHVPKDGRHECCPLDTAAAGSQRCRQAARSAREIGLAT